MSAPIIDVDENLEGETPLPLSPLPPVSEDTILLLVTKPPNVLGMIPILEPAATFEAPAIFDAPSTLLDNPASNAPAI